MATWEEMEQFANQYTESGGLFIRLKNDGDSVLGVFCGDPHKRLVHWIDGSSYECTGEKCEHCSDGDKAKVRFMINFYATELKEMKIYEGGITWFKSVCKVRAKYGIDKRIFEIQRQGGAGDPKTTYTVLPDSEITPDIQQAIDKCPLNNLETINGDNSKHENKSESIPSDGYISTETAKEIFETLRSYPRPQVDAFLAEFNLQKIRDLKIIDLEEAKSFLAMMAEDNGNADVMKNLF